MLPEIIILVLLYTQEIFSRLNGIHFQIEEDIETLQEGISRTIESKDMLGIKHSNYNQDLGRYMLARVDQVERLKENEEIEKKIMDKLKADQIKDKKSEVDE
jgi:UTP-glucose-1-phosphate uridylyltransferase